MVDISIDDELKISDFKYDLNCNNGSTTTTLKSGTGVDFTSSDITLGTLSTSDNTFNVNNSYTCTLRIWLNESGADQNSLMNKHFSSLIKVESMYRK